MTRDGLVETNVFGENQKRVSRRFENEDFSVRHRGEDNETFRVESTSVTDKKRPNPQERLPEEAGAEEFPGKSCEESVDETLADSSKRHTRHSQRYSSITSASAMETALQERHQSRQKEKTESRLKQKKARQRLEEETAGQSETFSDSKETIAKKRKKEQTLQAARKQGRLSFGDEVSGGASMAMGASGTVVRRAAGVGTQMLRKNNWEEGEEKEPQDGLPEAGHFAERAVRKEKQKIRKKSKRSRLRETSLDETEEASQHLRRVQSAERKNSAAAKRHAMQKQRIRKEYQKAAYRAAKSGEAGTTVATKITEMAVRQSLTIKSAVKEQIFRKKSLLVSGGILLLVFLFLMVGLSSCSAMLQGTSTPIISTTYASTDEQIYAVENAYAALESALNAQINQMKSTHPGYDDYDYQVDEISHNPYYLISYFTAKYGEFTYQQVKDEVEEIFRAQYSLSVDSIQETVTETKTVRVGESLGQVVTSGYCSCSICCGIWAGSPTASGAYPSGNHTIAVDASNPFVPMGTKIVMNGVEYTVEDTGNFAQYGVQFDVYYDDHSAASAHGHQTWEAYIADSNGSQEIEVTTTEEVNRLNVTLTNKGLDAVLRSRMTENERKRYDLYNLTYGNRDYLFDVNTLPSYGSTGSGYEIPPEALSDQKFAKMITEAEKYLGYPYVWGGSSPSTSFDCSGYVSWVINNCGNGWSYGRLTADGLLGICTVVSPSEAKPGDLIFFQGTYDTPGASHVGIYVGDGMMIHCGNPIQYTSINTSYWQEHFYHFGRLP
jgi:cell wall-associated NlpC family hydrolase